MVINSNFLTGEEGAGLLLWGGARHKLKLKAEYLVTREFKEKKEVFLVDVRSATLELGYGWTPKPKELAYAPEPEQAPLQPALSQVFTVR